MEEDSEIDMIKGGIPAVFSGSEEGSGLPCGFSSMPHQSRLSASLRRACPHSLLFHLHGLDKVWPGDDQPAPGVGNAVRAATDVGQAWTLGEDDSRSAERTIREPIGQLRWSRAFFLWQIL